MTKKGIKLIGKEKWVTLYRYNLETKSLTAIKSDYHKDDYLAVPNKLKDNPDYVDTTRFKDISISNLNIENNKIYYQNGSDIHCLSLDGKQDDIIYRSAGKIDWMETGFHSIEKVNLTPPYTGDYAYKCYFNTIDLNGELISSIEVSLDFYEKLEMHNLFFDVQSNSYLAWSEDQLIRLPFDNPEEYILLAKIEKTKEQNMFNIIMAGGSIFISAYDGVDHKTNNYCIMNVSDQNEVITIIENGKAVL